MPKIDSWRRREWTGCLAFTFESSYFKGTSVPGRSSIYVSIQTLIKKKQKPLLCLGLALANNCCFLKNLVVLVLSIFGCCASLAVVYWKLKRINPSKCGYCHPRPCLDLHGLCEMNSTILPFGSIPFAPKIPTRLPFRFHPIIPNIAVFFYLSSNFTIVSKHVRKQYFLLYLSSLIFKASSRFSGTENI